METQNQAKNSTVNINKPGYVVFTFVGLIYMLVQDFSQAAIFVSLALVFDPFDLQKPFKERPLYQRIWPVVHVAVSLILFALLIGKGLD